MNNKLLGFQIFINFVLNKIRWGIDFRQNFSPLS
jgi:hypothetical protein